MSNLYRGPSIDVSYQVSVHLAKRSVSEEKIKKNRPIRNKNCLWRPCLLMDRDKISNLYKGPSIDASYQVSVHLGKRFQRRRFFRNQPIINKNGLWRPSLTNRDEMSNLDRGPSIQAFYQISVHSGKRFQRRRFFRNQPIRNKNGLWWPCLLTDRDEMSNLYRGPSIDVSYQVSVHLAKRFQRKRFFKNRPIRNKNCLWWPCLLMDRDKISNLYKGPFHRCFQPSFSSFGKAVSEKIF